MTSLESRLRCAAEALDAAAEGWESATPGSSEGPARQTRSRRLLITAGAAATILAGLIAVAVLARDEDSRSPAGPPPIDGGPAATTPATPATAAPGVPEPPAGDELTAALENLGVDVKSAPPGAMRLDGALFCGVSTWTRPAVSTLQPSHPAQCIADNQHGPDPLVFVLQDVDRDPDQRVITVWRSIPGKGVRFYSHSEDGGEWSTSACELVFYRRGTPTRSPQFGCDDDREAAMTTTTVPPPPNQLATVLRALGVDVDAAPPGATRLDAEYCGVDRFSDSQPEEPQTEAQRCLIVRYEAGERAIAVTEWITPEGSPVITIYRADPEGAVDVYTDSTRDADFGSGVWEVSACDGVTYAERSGLSLRGCRSGR